MIQTKSNILSYFIRNIDKNEHQYYTQLNNIYSIEIIYKETQIYYMRILAKYIYTITNRIENIYKFIEFDTVCSVCNNKFFNNKKYKYSIHYYNRDHILNSKAINYLTYVYQINKYINKITFDFYVYDIKTLTINIYYATMYKFIFKCKNMYKKLRNIFYSIILINNKYEMQYINRFFYLYFEIEIDFLL
jgi:hypothetical protein